MHPGSTPHAGDDRSVSPQEKSEASVYFLSEGEFEFGQSHPSLLISTLSWQSDCREAGNFSYNKVNIKAGPTNV